MRLRWWSLGFLFGVRKSLTVLSARLLWTHRRCDLWRGVILATIPICCQKGVPAQIAVLGAWLLREPDSHISHVLDHPIEVKWGQRVDIHVGSGVHEVDGVGNAVANGPLERIHIVPQGAHELQCIINDAATEFRTEMLVLNVIFALAWIVLDRHDFFLSQGDAANVLLPVDEFLNDHCAQAKIVIVMY